MEPLENDFSLVIINRMSVQQSIFDGTNINVRHIEAPEGLKRFLKAYSEYKELYKSPSDDELRGLPSGVLLTQVGLARRISNAGPRDHLQLICYRQPLLGNLSTDLFLRTVIENKEGKYAKDVQEYVRSGSAQMYVDFPFAFQMAYDIYTADTITEKTRERKKLIDDRFAEIMENL